MPKTSRMDHNKVKAFYEAQVAEYPHWPALLDVHSWLTADFRVYEEWLTLLNLVPLNENMRILELGCGGGRWIERFSPFVKEAVGVDFSANAIQCARKRAEAKGIRNATYVLASITDYEPKGFFDLVYYSAVLLYLDDMEVINNITRYARYLSPHGFFLVRDSVANQTHSLDHVGYSAIYRSIDQWEMFFQTMGFQLRIRRKAQPSLLYPRFWDSRPTNRVYRLLKRLNLSKALFLLMERFLCNKNIATTPQREDAYVHSHDFMIFDR